MWLDPEKRPSCRRRLPDGIYHDPTKTNDKDRQIYRHQPRPA
jgi:hypothetical protein